MPQPFRTKCFQRNRTCLLSVVWIVQVCSLRKEPLRLQLKSKYRAICPPRWRECRYWTPFNTAARQLELWLRSGDHMCVKWTGILAYIRQARYRSGSSAAHMFIEHLLREKPMRSDKRRGTRDEKGTLMRTWSMNRKKAWPFFPVGHINSMNKSPSNRAMNCLKMIQNH